MIFYELLVQARSNHMDKNAAALRSPGEQLENRCLRPPSTIISYWVLSKKKKKISFNCMDGCVSLMVAHITYTNIDQRQGNSIKLLASTISQEQVRNLETG